VVSADEARIARELVAVRRAVALFLDAVRLLAHTPAQLALLAIVMNTRMAELEADVARLTADLQAAGRAHKSRAARAQCTINEIDATMVQLLQARDAAFRTTT
jgi:outer membrane murein-binding lipoprotein Lpp